MNKIVFTQDVPGEREWLATQFPGYENLETEFSGKWPAVPFAQNHNTLWEIPPDSTMDVSAVVCDKHKSLYQLDLDFISPKWCDSSHLLLNNLDFTSQPRAKKAQVLHFPRSGTVFLESILFRKCGYDKDRGWNQVDPISDHAAMGGNDQVLYNLLTKSQPDIFLCYRSDWWAWALSILISKNFDYWHYLDVVDWDQLPPFEVSARDFDYLVAEVRARWQALCHMRTQFPHFNFYIFEFSELIKNGHLTDHKAINYDKKKLIANYTQAETLFKSEYLSKFQVWEKNSIGHLQTMRCQITTSFDKFIG
jgi:hypothetical protein